MPIDLYNCLDCLCAYLAGKQRGSREEGWGRGGDRGGASDQAIIDMSCKTKR